MDENLKKQLEPVVDDIVERTSEKVTEKVTPAITKDVFEQLKEELPKRKDLFGGETTQADERKKELEGKQKAAEFIKAVYQRDSAQVKALSEGTADEGGYFVPEIFANEIIRLAPKYGLIRRQARNYPASGEGYKTHLPTVSNVTAYRVNESATITSSQPTTGQVNITIKKVAALIPMSNELLKDANVATVDILSMLSAEAFAKYEDEWGFLGKAAGEGIFQNTNVPALTLGAGDTTYDAVDFDDLLDVLGKLDESALPGARFYMSFSVFNALRKKKHSSGTNSYILQEPGGGQPATIWNVPVELSRVLPKTTDGTQTDKDFIALGDLNYMLFADKREYSVDISQEATITDTDGSTKIDLFAQDMSAIRVIERVDIQLAEADKAFATVKTAAA